MHFRTFPTAMLCAALAGGFVVSLAGVSPALGQTHNHNAPPEEYVGPPVTIPHSLLTREATLRQGIGTVHEAVPTHSPEAQAFYDQGLAYLHSYVQVEAIRSFHQALRHDPSLSMAWLAMVRAYLFLEDWPAAQAALDSARAAGATDDRTARRIAIVELQLASLEEPDDAARLAAYRQAIDDALAHELDNPELWLLRGNASEDGAWGRGQLGGVPSIAFYEQALRLRPGHFAAHHYLTHTYEVLGLTDSALVHGEAFARQVPAVPHAQHMHAHNLMRVGRIDEAILQFERADSLERAYYDEEQVDPSYDWHRPHNLELLAHMYLHQGRMRDAERALREVRTLRTLAVPMYIYFRRALPEFLLLRGRPDEAIAAAEELVAHPAPPARMLGHLIRGEAFLAQRRIEDARTELAAAEGEIEGDLRAAGPFQVQIDGLRAGLALHDGDAAEGAALLRRAMQSSAMVPGPDGWVIALLRIDWLAQVARDAGDWALAEEIARGLIQHAPTYAGGQYALGLALERSGDSAAAREAFARAATWWQQADADLPERSDLERRLGTTD